MQQESQSLDPSFFSLSSQSSSLTRDWSPKNNFSLCPDPPLFTCSTSCTLLWTPVTSLVSQSWGKLSGEESHPCNWFILVARKRRDPSCLAIKSMNEGEVRDSNERQGKEKERERKNPQGWFDQRSQWRERSPKTWWTSRLVSRVQSFFLTQEEEEETLFPSRVDHK